MLIVPLTSFNIKSTSLSQRTFLIAFILLVFLHATMQAIYYLSDVPQYGNITSQIAHIVISIMVIIALLRTPKANIPIKEKGFWFSLTVSLLIWTTSKSALLMADVFRLADWIYLIANYGYFAFFLCFLFALQLISVKDDGTQKEMAFQYGLDQWLSLIFMGALFVYLIIVLPQGQSQDAYSQYSAFLFHILMNLLLLSICLRQAITNHSAQWQSRLAWFATTFVLFIVIHCTYFFTSMMPSANGVESLHFALGLLPYISLMMGICTRQNKQPALTNRIKQLRLFHANRQKASLAVFLVLLPFIHFLGYRLNLLALEVKSEREVIVFMWIVIFATYLYFEKNDKRRAVSDKNAPTFPAKSTDEANTIQLSKIPFPCFLLSDRGHIQMSNSAAVNLFGYDESKLHDAHFSSLLDKNEPLADILRHSDKSFSHSQLLANNIREVHCQHQNGHTLYCYLTFSQNNPTTSLVTLVDITSLHNAEIQALSIKDKFLANITHEFRTPLTIIQGVIDEGLEKEQDPVFHKRLIAAKTNSVRVLKMVEQLLNLSRLTSAPKLNITVQPASQIIHDSCRQFEDLCQRKGIKFNAIIDKDIWVKVHEDALQQVLYNLLSNAWKYSDPASEINIEAIRDELNLVLSITDTGYGMSQEDQAKLFERFQRADSAKSSATFGVGIGLSLVSELVALHEWRIQVNSVLNEGTTFKLELPIAEPPANKEKVVRIIDFNSELPQQVPLAQFDSRDQYPLPEEDQPTSNQTVSLNRVLIIEDNPDMQDHLYHLLNRQFQVEIKGTGMEGIEHATNDIPDLIICDLMLPDISGFDIVEQLKNHEFTQHIPIIMLTAKADTQSKITGLEKQADDYLTKPFNHRELTLRIENLLNLREKIQSLLRSQLDKGLLPDNSIRAVTETADETKDHQVLPHQTFLEKLQKTIKKYYTIEDFSIAQLASDLAMSERQLQRKLKAALNITPGEYIREYRLIKARDLLKSGMSVGQVSEAVGFSSQNYFARCFKLQNGKTPSEYQKSQA